MSPAARVVDDVLALAVPAHLDPADPAQRERLGLLLVVQAERTVWAQWPPGRGPRAIAFAAIEWCFADRIEQVEAFQPAHDCPACRAGNDRAEAFLRANPGRWVALANLHYTVEWT